MSTVATTQPYHQVVASSLCEAVSEHLLAGTAAMQSDGGVQLFALIDGAIEAGIRNAFAVLAERYAAGVLGAERCARVGTRGSYRSGSRTIRMASPVGPLDRTLVKSRNGLLRPPALRAVTPRDETQTKAGHISMWDLFEELLQIRITKSSLPAERHEMAPTLKDKREVWLTFTQIFCAALADVFLPA